jgi:hypothetical protein
VKRASVIVFSHRARGNSDLAGELLARKCRQAGLDTAILRSREHPLQACTGCMRCMFRHPGKCHLADSLPAYLDALAADVLFLVSPVYFLTPAADWKLLQDRMLVSRPRSGGEGRFAGIVLTAGLRGWSVAEPLMAVLALSAGFRVAGVETLIGPGPGHFLVEESNLGRLDQLARAVLAGEPQPRQGGCAVCFGPLQQSADGWFCAVCQARADEKGEIRYEDSRWHPRRLEEHYKEWVLATRELFLRDRSRIKKKINELNLEGSVENQ